MDYPTNPNDLASILPRSEFRYMLDPTNPDAKKTEFQLQGNQIFERNFISPNTPYTRLLIKDEPGTGKTISSLSIAKQFADLYMRTYVAIGNTVETPYVFIIGFTKKIFQDELLSKTVFGMVTEEEIKEMNSYPIGSEEHRVIKNKFRRRLGKKHANGFYRFYGYKELFNQLFVNKYNTEIVSESDIIEAIKSEKITINTDLLNSFRNGVIICDEVHNLYNNQEVNTWGLAIKFIVNMYDTSCKNWEKVLPNYSNIRENILGTELRLLLLSATIGMHKVEENINLLNLLIPHRHNGFGRDIVESDLFDSTGITKTGKQKLRNILLGYVVYMRDDNPRFFPKKVWEGDSIPIPKKYYAQRVFDDVVVPYIKTISVDYSDLHRQLVDSLPQDLLFILNDAAVFDYALPNPEGTEPLYKYRDIRSKYIAADASWLEKHGIVFQELDGSYEITGSILDINTFRKYSNKFYKLYQDAVEILKKGGGKHLISHDIVHGSGTTLIKNLFLYNGFVDDNTAVTSNTLCAMCGVPQGKHGAAHAYKPAKLMHITGALDKNLMDIYLNRWNSTTNLNGEEYTVCIGSEVIEESINFRATNYMSIMTPPKNFSTLIQKFKRPYRKYAFSDLPSEKRVYHIRLYTYKHPDSKRLSPDQYRLFIGSQEHRKIETVDRIYNSVAMTSQLFYDKMFPNPNPPKDELGNVYFTPDELIKNISKLPEIRDTFDFYYQEERIGKIISIIKYLFTLVFIVVEEKDLLRAIRSPPDYSSDINLGVLSDDDIYSAIHDITNRADISIVPGTGPDIVLEDTTYRIFSYSMGKNKTYYIRLPYNGTPITVNNSWLFTPAIKQVPVNISNLIEHHRPYEDIKSEFISKYRNAHISDIPIGLNYFDLEFHERLMQESVMYLFNTLTLSNAARSENHEFYIRMLNFYEKMELIVFADMINESDNPELNRFVDIYKKYVNYDEKLSEAQNEEGKELGRFLMTSIARTQNGSTFNVNRLNMYIDAKVVGALAKAPKDKIRVFRPAAYMVPVGYFSATRMDATGTMPTNSPPNIRLFVNFWNPISGKWEQSHNYIPNYLDGDKYTEVENDIIIGYQERLPGMLNYKFKVRKPIGSIQKQRDLRKLPRGNICNSFTKDVLMGIVSSLGLKVGAHIKDQCNAIRIELLRREIAEKRRLHRAHAEGKPYKKVRWFYQYFESMPNL